MTITKTINVCALGCSDVRNSINIKCSLSKSFPGRA